MAGRQADSHSVTALSHVFEYWYVALRHVPLPRLLQPLSCLYSLLDTQLCGQPSYQAGFCSGPELHLNDNQCVTCCYQTICMI